MAYFTVFIQIRGSLFLFFEKPIDEIEKLHLLGTTYRVNFRSILLNKFYFTIKRYRKKKHHSKNS